MREWQDIYLKYLNCFIKFLHIVMFLSISNCPLS